MLPPGLREALEQEIADELARMSNEDKEAISSKIPAELPPLFQNNAFLASELKRLQGKAKTKGGLDSVRYSLPVPPASAPLEAWNKAINNAASQLEHQKIRLGNLDLLAKYGANSWRTNNFLIEKEVERLQRRKEEIVKQTEDLNRERKANQVSDTTLSLPCSILVKRLILTSSRSSYHLSTHLQLEAGSQLSSLESKWTTLVSNNIQLELANLTLEMELDTLREREEELKSKLQELESQ
jgi:pre-mRNA-splicing factor SPF27